MSLSDNIRAAEAAAEGDSNDDEIAALQEVMWLVAKVLPDIALAVNDAYGYRVGEATDLDDPDLEPIDRDHAVRYATLARTLGIELSA